MVHARLRTVISGLAAGLLTLGFLVTTAAPAAADTQLGGCLVIDNPTLAVHSECAGADLGTVASTYNLNYADLSHSSLAASSNLSYSTFVGADLTDAQWFHIGVTGGDFTGAVLDGLDLGSNVVPNTTFADASIVGADMTWGVYRGVSFAGADLTNTDFTGGNFDAAAPADFTGATLTGTIFDQTKLVPDSPAAVTATGPDGAAVTWDAPQAMTGVQLGECSTSQGTVSSGSTFPVGATTVTCKIESTSNGTFGTGTFTVTVNPQQDAASITSAASTTFVVGSAGSFTVQASGTSTPSLSESGALPSGVGFVDNGDGTATLSGTPGPGTGGAHPVEFTATVGSASDVQSFALTVNEAPSITSADHGSFIVGQEGTFTATAVGFPAPTIIESGALPDGVVFADGVLSGTPLAGSGGSYPLTLTASNGVGSGATQQFTLTVNEAPAITSPSTATFGVDNEGSFTVTTSGFPATASISTTSPLPSGLSLTDNGDGTATLSGRPDSVGSYSVLLLASNGVTPDASQTLTVTVNAMPAITSADHATFTVGQQGTFTTSATGFPVPTITESGALPDGVSFVDGVFSGTPLAGSGGSYPVALTASNGVGADGLQQFTLTVNEAPVITSPDAVTFAVGAVGTFTVLSTGAPAAAITESGALPAGIQLTDNGDGTATLAGTPEALTGGTYPVTITAANGIGSDATQEFTLTVNEAPVITSPDHGELSIATNGSITVGTAGFPAPTLTADGPLPDGVTFVDNGDGTATLGGTPEAGTGGSYPITITADNAISPSAVQAFTLTISLVASTTTLTTSPNPAVTGKPLTLKVTVDPPSGAPSGTVEFFDGTTSLGTATLAASSRTTSSAALTITTFAVGKHSITAVYSGDSSYASSTSAALALVVLAAPTPPDPSSDATNPAGTGAVATDTDAGPDASDAVPVNGSAELADTGTQVSSLLAMGVLLALLGGLLLMIASGRRPRRD